MSAIVVHYLRAVGYCAGVGQSLYSSHLHAVYSPNHAFIDPNIWYDEHEMRKQIEQSAGCFILTAQEKPENSRRMREDLFKKTMSADGIAGRRPYGLQTRMIELVGWKRYEVNSMIRFANVCERNFPSANRRGFVWHPKARFIDEAIIAGPYPDANRDGYFKKDEELKAFLKSPPCVAAALRLQHAFEISHGPHDCRQMIEDLASQPLTEDSMREACGLPPRHRSSEPEPALAVPVDPSSQDEEKELTQKLKNVAAAIQEYCLQTNRNPMTKGMWKYVKLPSNHPTNLDREMMWKALLERNFLLPVIEKSDKYKDAVIPFIDVGRPLSEVVPLQIDTNECLHQEVHDVEAARKYIQGNSGREANVATVIKYLGAVAKHLRKPGRAGKQSAARHDEIAALEKLSKKMSDREETLASFVTQQEKQETGAKRRRTGKTPGSRIETPDFSYNRCFQGLVRTRAYAQGLAAQKFSRSMQRILCPDTHDLDIQNAMFVLLSQLLHKLNVNSTIPEHVLKTMDECAAKRDEICKNELKVSVQDGKKLLHEIFFGSGIPAAHASNAFLLQLQKAAIYCKWLACSLLPDVFQRVMTLPDKPNPQASTLFYMYAAVEDCVLDAWDRSLCRRHPRHVSLHFDGIRVGGIDPAVDVKTLCDEATQAIQEKTQFDVSVVENLHLFFRELCRSPPESSEVPVEHEELLAQGNCIPLALVRLLPDRLEDVLKVLNKKDHKNAAAKRSGTRCYSFMLNELSIQVAPRYGLRLEGAGQYLLHSEHDGNPHCLGCHIRDNGLVEIWDGVYKTRMNTSELIQFGAASLDSGTIATFQIVGDAQPDPDAAAEASACSILLGLHAGAGELQEEWSECLQDVCECVGPDPGSEDECDVMDEEEDEVVVRVGDSLLTQLRQEVERCARTVERRVHRCPLCPFRRFQAPSRLQEHIRRYHTEARQFICSGTKQLKVCCALFDHDQIQGCARGNYLARSSELLRTMVAPALSHTVNEIDREIRLVLTGRGPEYWAQSSLQSCNVRRVRNLYYTHEFADLVYQELLLCHAKCKTAAGQV